MQYLESLFAAVQTLSYVYDASFGKVHPILLGGYYLLQRLLRYSQNSEDSSSSELLIFLPFPISPRRKATAAFATHLVASSQVK